jgi:TRAP-type C4-dicarboxylate transport system permease small subunit
MKPEVHTEITAEELAHAFEEPAPEVDLKQYGVEDWATLAIFWLMAFAVFLQFFTRYVLNDSFAWTEEIATYCLVAVVFLGAAMCVRLGRHIHVDLLFRYLPARVARALATMIDAIRTLFFAAFILMFLRSVQVSIDNWRRGYSILERPEAFDAAPI